MSGKIRLMQGNEACVEGAIAAGLRFFAGYPITPSTEVAEGCSVRLPQVGGRFIQMEDEIASIAAIIGGSAAGVKSMTATSGPGLSLMQENIGYAAMAEVPIVVVNVQRNGPSTGRPTSPAQADYMQAKWGTHGDHPVIALSPSSVSETYTLMVRAFNLSEKYRVPVIMLMDEIIGHLREGIEIPEADTLEIVNRKPSGVKGYNHDCFRVEEGEWVPAMAPFGEGQRYNITGLTHDESGFPTNDAGKAQRLMRRLLDKVEANRADIEQTELYRMDDAEKAVVCFGGTARAAMEAIEALREKGEKVGMIRPVTVWPFPAETIREQAAKLKKIVVAEHSDGQMLLEVDRVIRGGCPIAFVGNINGTMIRPEEIMKALEEE